MKQKTASHLGVQELCRKLKIQLDELAVTLTPALNPEEKTRRTQLMERLKSQIAELSR
jgi:hypothetical protein